MIEYMSILGIMGAILIIIAFVLNLINKLNSNSKIYLILNIVGSSLVLIDVSYKNAFSAIITNLVWLIFSAYTLINNKNFK